MKLCMVCGMCYVGQAHDSRCSEWARSVLSARLSMTRVGIAASRSRQPRMRWSVDLDPAGTLERLSSSSSSPTSASVRVRHFTSCAWWLGFLIGVGVNAVTSSSKGKGACFQLQIVALMYMYRTMYIRRFLYKGPRGRWRLSLWQADAWRLESSR